MVRASKSRNGRVPLRVLIAEASEDDARLLLRELRRGGCEPDYEWVASAAEMRTALEAAEWDVIISDYHLPNVRGPEVLELAREVGSEAPLIIVSNKAGEDGAVDAIEYGAYDYR